MFTTIAPFQQYFDSDGSPLDSGYITYGQPNQNPDTSPIPVFWDAAGTQPAAQPIRTLNGYTVRNGTPTPIFCAGEYSVLVKSQRGVSIAYSASPNDFLSKLSSTTDAAAGSALIGYKPNLTGAVGRTLSAKLGEHISVKDFGATGDGSTDDLAAITAAIAALSATVGDLYFPPGSYKVSGPMVVNKACNIFGAGNTSKIVTSHATADVVQITANNVTISDLEVNTSVGRTAGTGYYINIVSAHGVTLERLVLTSWYNAIGYTGTGGAYSRIRDCNIQTSGNGGIGINVATSSDVIDMLVRDVLIAGPGVGAQPAIGIQILRGGDITLDHVSTVKTGTGLNVVPGAGTAMQCLFVTNCLFDSGAGSGINLSPGAGASIQLAKFANVWSCTNVNGMVIAGAGQNLRTEIINCTLSNNASGSGLIINSTTATDVLMVGGSCSANTNGIVVAASVTNFKILGVKSGACGQFAGNSNVGLAMGNGCNLFTIADCDFTSNVTAAQAIGTLPAGAGATFFIRDNQGIVTRNSSTVTLTSGAAATAVNHGLASTPRLEDITITNNSGWGTASKFWVTSPTSTQFTINTDANPGPGVLVGFRAALWGAD